MIPQTANQKILVVDDNHGVYQLIAPNLAAESFTVSYMSTAAEAASADLASYSLVIVDAMNQEFNGLHLISQLKANPPTQHIPVMLCTTEDSQDAIIRGFEVGADDYVTKPFSVRELVARAKAMLRRSVRLGAPEPEMSQRSMVSRTLPTSQIAFCGMTVDPSRRTLLAPNGDNISVTQTEFAILALLLANMNTYISREQIRATVWAHRPDNVNDRTIDVNISRLRKKLGPMAQHLVNKSGRGYAMLENV